MDSRSALMMSLLVALVACQPLRNEQINETLNAARNSTLVETKSALRLLRSLFINSSCSSVNVTQLIGPEQQILTASWASSIGCYMNQFSQCVGELRGQLGTIAQFMQDLGERLGSQGPPQNCSLPVFKSTQSRYKYAMCFLEHVGHRLGKSKL